MTFQDVYQILSSIRPSATTTDTIPCAYYQFPEDDPANPAPSPPYITYFYPESADLMADDKNYVSIRKLEIALYCANKNFLLEQAVEEALKSSELTFYKYEDYIDSEKLYITTYETEVLING